MLDPQLSALLIEFGYDPKTIEAMLSGAIYLTIISVVAAVPTGLFAKRTAAPTPSASPAKSP